MNELQNIALQPAFCRSLGTGLWGVAAERLGLLVGAAGLVRLPAGPLLARMRLERA